jgi:hypothetical protein
VSDAAEIAGDDSQPSTPGRSREVILEACGKEHVFARQSQEQERLDHEYDEHCATLLIEKTTDPLDDNTPEAMATQP